MYYNIREYTYVYMYSMHALAACLAHLSSTAHS